MKLNRDALLILKKAIIYFVAAFVAALLQTSFLAVVAPFGSVPDLVLLLVLGAGYFCGPTVGGIFGLVAGVLAYAIGGVGFAVEPLLYTAVGAFTGCLDMENAYPRIYRHGRSRCRPLPSRAEGLRLLLVDALH